jgi:hypothetical protein
VQVLPLQHSGNDAGLIDAEATLVGAGVMKLELTVGMSRFTFAVDVEPGSGVLRELAATVAMSAGVDRDAVLAAIVAAGGHPHTASRRAAA